MSFDLSLAGVIGAAVGLAIGVIDYGIVAALLRRAFEARAAKAGSVTRSDGRRLDWILKAAFVVICVALSALGYWFGRTIGG